MSQTECTHILCKCNEAERERYQFLNDKEGCTQQVLVCTDNVNILGGSIHTIKENAVVFVVASKVTGLEVNAAKTRYMVMSLDHTAGRKHSIKNDKSSFQRVEDLKYLGLRGMR